MSHSSCTRPQGVQILSIMIQSCTLPSEIESQMADKTKVISLNAQQRMFHQNNMQNTRMEEEIVTMMQTFEEQRTQEESTGREMINEEKVKLDDARAEAVKSEATIVEEGIARIEKLRAESALEVQRINNRKDETIATMKLNGEVLFYMQRERIIFFMCAVADKFLWRRSDGPLRLELRFVWLQLLDF